jgi:hypothetical protein
VKALQTNSFFERADQVGQERKRWDAIWNGDETLYEIGKEVHNSFVAEARLGYFLAIFGLDALELYFEDIISDLPSTCEKVELYIRNKFLFEERGSEGSAYTPRLQKQSTDEDEAIRRLFLRSFNPSSCE